MEIAQHLINVLIFLSPALAVVVILCMFPTKTAKNTASTATGRRTFPIVTVHWPHVNKTWYVVGDEYFREDDFKSAYRYMKLRQAMSDGLTARETYT